MSFVSPMAFNIHDGLTCDLCGGSLYKRGHRWIALNRHVVGAGTKVMMVPATDGEVVWDREQREFTGKTLCFPGCFFSWIEAQLVECESKKKP